MGVLIVQIVGLCSELLMRLSYYFHLNYNKTLRKSIPRPFGLELSDVPNRLARTVTHFTVVHVPRFPDIRILKHQKHVSIARYPNASITRLNFVRISKHRVLIIQYLVTRLLKSKPKVSRFWMYGL